jgi:hypothetical protein
MCEWTELERKRASLRAVFVNVMCVCFFVCVIDADVLLFSLQMHTCGTEKTVVYSPVDLEGHRGTDGVMLCCVVLRFCVVLCSAVLCCTLRDAFLCDGALLCCAVMFVCCAVLLCLCASVREHAEANTRGKLTTKLPPAHTKPQISSRRARCLTHVFVSFCDLLPHEFSVKNRALLLAGFLACVPSHQTPSRRKSCFPYRS